MVRSLKSGDLNNFILMSVIMFDACVYLSNGQQQQHQQVGLRIYHDATKHVTKSRTKLQ